MNYPNLKAEMARNGITVDDIATEMGVSRRTASNWLNGSTIKHSTVLQIRDSLFPGLSVEYLFDLSPQTASATQRSV